jgi:hypothetical protein
MKFTVTHFSIYFEISCHLRLFAVENMLLSKSRIQSMQLLFTIDRIFSCGTLYEGNAKIGFNIFTLDLSDRGAGGLSLETATLCGCISRGGKKVKLPCNRLWRPIGLGDFKAPTFSRQWAHRWR